MRTKRMASSLLLASLLSATPVGQAAADVAEGSKEADELQNPAPVVEATGELATGPGKLVAASIDRTPSDGSINLSLKFELPTPGSYRYPNGIAPGDTGTDAISEAFTVWAFVFNDPSGCITNPDVEEEARCGADDFDWKKIKPNYSAQTRREKFARQGFKPAERKLMVKMEKRQIVIDHLKEKAKFGLFRVWGYPPGPLDPSAASVGTVSIGGSVPLGASGTGPDGDPPVTYFDTTALAGAEIHAVILPNGKAATDENGDVLVNPWAFMESEPIKAFNNGFGWRAVYRSAPSELAAPSE